MAAQDSLVGIYRFRYSFRSVYGEFNGSIYIVLRLSRYVDSTELGIIIISMDIILMLTLIPRMTLRLLPGWFQRQIDKAEKGVFAKVIPMVLNLFLSQFFDTGTNSKGEQVFVPQAHTRKLIAGLMPGYLNPETGEEKSITVPFLGDVTPSQMIGFAHAAKEIVPIIKDIREAWGGAMGAKATEYLLP